MNYLERPYHRIIVSDKESGTFTSYVAEFPGCIAQGDTPAEAYERLEVAAESWIEAALEIGQEIPKPYPLRVAVDFGCVQFLPKVG